MVIADPAKVMNSRLQDLMRNHRSSMRVNIDLAQEVVRPETGFLSHSILIKCLYDAAEEPIEYLRHSRSLYNVRLVVCL